MDRNSNRGQIITELLFLIIAMSIFAAYLTQIITVGNERQRNYRFTNKSQGAAKEYYDKIKRAYQ